MLQFKSIEDMERYWYGDINADMIKKADASVYTSTTGFWNKVYGAKVWSQVNYEKNALAAIPKEPWNQSGWRMETASGDSYPSGGVAEGTHSAYTDVPDTITPTWRNTSASPKTIAHSYGATEIGYILAQGGIDDNIPFEVLRETKGKSHARAQSAYIVQDVDTTAGNGYESVDRIGFTSAYSTTAYVSNEADPNIYGFDRSAANTFDAQVTAAGSEAGDLRDLTVSLIDGVWASVTKAGGIPDFILTGYNTIKVWSALLEAERRFSMDMATYVPRFNEAAGVTPGVEAGFSVATYFGVPIIPCQDYDSSIASARTNEVAPIFFGDSRYIRLAVLRPTLAREMNLGNDVITFGKHALEGEFSTIGELRCYNFAAQGKVQDIK
jgi:hypothetical protein